MAKKKSVAAPWGNRIIGYGSLPASQFLANESNWRIHPRNQQDAIESVLGEVGFVQSVIVNKRTDSAWGKDRGVETLVDGHMRVEVALSRGEDTIVPVVYVDLTPTEERLVLATFDPIAALAGRDDPKLLSLIDGLDTSVDIAAILQRDKSAVHVEFDAVEKRPAVIVECPNEFQQGELMEKLRADGWVCRAATT